MMTIIFFQHVDLDGSQSKLKSLKILSLGRNNIKRIVGLDEIGQTLE